MIIYTDLPENSVIFRRLKAVSATYNLDLRCGVIGDTDVSQTANFNKKKVLFWFAKTNAKKLTYYRACDALELIWKGFVILENYSELIK